MANKSMECKKIEGLLTAYLDSEVTDKERQHIEQHLTSCQKCSDELVAMTRTRDVLRQALSSKASEEDPLPDTWVRIQERIMVETKSSFWDNLRNFIPQSTAWRAALSTAVVVIIVIAAVVLGTGGGTNKSMLGPRTEPLWDSTASDHERGDGEQSFDEATTTTVPTAPGIAPAEEGRFGLTSPAPQEPVPPVPAPEPSPDDEVRIKEQTALQANGAGEINRMIVRTGNMQLVVDDVLDTIDSIIGLADRFEGYVVSSNSWREDDRVYGAIAIRVPAEYFTEAMDALGEMAVEVKSQDIYSIDVTEEYVDLSARLQNLEVTEQQLIRIMEKAEEVDDILDVQRELTDTREEIERIKGRMQYLQQTSDTSLIEIQLEQAKLEVKLNASKRNLERGEEVLFEAIIAGGFQPYSYEWDFGDGSTSTEGYPQHVYKSSGSYTVTLTVTDDKGNTDTEIRKNYINVLPAWRAGTTVTNALNSLISFGRGLANIFIWLGIFSPVWIIAGGLIFWFWRKRRRG
jgi:anti-sigma factor RsiW